jgi:hypothetical protein
MLIALIATAWLGASALCWALCAMAARGDAAMATAARGDAEHPRPAGQRTPAGRGPVMRPDMPRLTVG